MQKPTIFCPLFGWFSIHFWMVFHPFLDGFWSIEMAMAIRPFLDVRFSEKAPRVDSNPRATSAVLLRALANGEYHRATAAVAG